MNTAVSEAGKTAVEHATEAAEAIRAINHVTYHAESLPYPSDAWRLLNHLASLAHRLGQALEQTGHLVGGKQQHGEIGIDHGTAYAGHPEMAVADCLTGLEDAVQATQLLAEALERAARPLTYAHYLDPLARDNNNDNNDDSDDDSDDDSGEDMGTDVTGEDRS